MPEKSYLHPGEYFINNRVLAFHLGCEGSVRSMNYIFKASWSKNYGTYWTTDEEQSTDIPNPGAYGIFGEQEQLSTYLELNRELKNGFNLGFIGAFDYGDLLYNSFGVFFKASYSFNLIRHFCTLVITFEYISGKTLRILRNSALSSVHLCRK